MFYSCAVGAAACLFDTLLFVCHILRAVYAAVRVGVPLIYRFITGDGVITRGDQNVTGLLTAVTQIAFKKYGL